MTGPELSPTRAFAQAMAGAERVTHRPTPADAFARARETLRAGRRLDMGQLAGELGVARATLYRWTGDRERLLGDACWAELAGIVGHLAGAAEGRGLERVRAAVAATLDVLSENAALQAFLAHEGDAGLRLVTAPNGPVRPRLVALVADLLREQVQRGDYRPPAEPELLADGLVALAERWLYHGGDRALNPDPETGRRVIGLLLREPCPGEAA